MDVVSGRMRNDVGLPGTFVSDINHHTQTCITRLPSTTYTSTVLTTHHMLLGQNGANSCG